MAEINYGLRCASCINMGVSDHNCFPAVPQHAQIPPLAPYEMRVQESKEKLREEIKEQIRSFALGQMGLIRFFHNIRRWNLLRNYKPYRGHEAMALQSIKSGRLSPQT